MHNFLELGIERQEAAELTGKARRCPEPEYFLDTGMVRKVISFIRFGKTSKCGYDLE